MFYACQESVQRSSEKENTTISTSENFEAEKSMREEKTDSTDIEIIDNHPKTELNGQSQTSNTGTPTANQNQSIWQIGTLVSIILNIILLLLLIKTMNSLKYQKQRKQKYKDDIFEVNKNASDLIAKNSSIIRNNNDLLKKINSTHEKKSVTNQYHDDEKSAEYIFNNINPNPKINPTPSSPEDKPKAVLFAGKPLESKVFTAVSPLQDEHKSIFRLTLENKEAYKAHFEVVENEYIMKMIANSPDTYLYNVCNPENSNQNFDGRILTTKKGIANLIDGEWIVKEENKATIKFQ